ncbi:MAG: hypothetical protein E7379_02400 [Clostridiales bacterium]|nr:hypothetical protein [Clostridiales bacterium]
MKKTFAIIAIVLSFALSIAGAIALGIHLPSYQKYCNPNCQSLNIAYENAGIVNRGNGNYTLVVDWVNTSGKEQELDLVVLIRETVYGDHFEVEDYKFEAVRWQGIIPKYTKIPSFYIDLNDIDTVDLSKPCDFYLYFYDDSLLFGGDEIFLPTGDELSFFDERTDKVKEPWQLASALSRNWNTAFSNLIMILSIIIGMGALIGGLGIVAIALKNKKAKTIETQQKKPISPYFNNRISKGE